MKTTTKPIRAALSALTVAGLLAVGCTVSAGPALAHTHDSTEASDTTPGGEAAEAIAAAQSAILEAESAAIAPAASDPATPPPTTAPTATPTPTIPAALSWARLAGADRYATAVAVAKYAYPKGARTVFVATGTNFPDALAAGPVAVAKNAPVLLTQRDSIPSSTLAQLKALHPTTIAVVGGTSAVSAKVATTLGKLSGVTRVTRIGGPDRLATSRLLANYGFGAKGADFAFIVTGANYPDALSVSAPAGTLGAPILLVNGKSRSIDSATYAQLKKLGVAYTLIAGGPAAVSGSLEYSTPTATARVAGDDRYGTNAMIASTLYLNEPTDPADERTTDFYVATGSNFPDALVGGVPAAHAAAPVLIVKKTAWPKDTLAFVKSNGFEQGYLLGGTAVLGDSLMKLKASF